MQIGLLKAGQLPAELESIAGSYPTMIRRALGSAYVYREFDVQQGELPGKTAVADGYVITGSASSVYHKSSWIDALRGWLTQLDPKIPIVGICFGHQLMAHAYGGLVKKADQGLAVGLHEYQVCLREAWMDETSRLVLPVSHYDQVVGLPPTARLIATSDLCPYAALSYSDRRAFSFQAHPEFDLDLTAALIDRWQQKGVIGAVEVRQAKASMNLPDDRARVGRWIRQFFGDT